MSDSVSTSEDEATLVDLFSGAGGLSVGFHQAGFRVIGGVDVEDVYTTTYARNHPDGTALTRDITELSGSELLEELGVASVDGLVGGPPCQGFSIAGRRNPEDERNNLVFHFVRLVNELRPEFFLMENVRGFNSMTTEEGQRFSDLTKERVDSDYSLTSAVLNAVEYGAPQKRLRFFLAGSRTENGVKLPEATHGLGTGLFTDTALTVEDALSDLPEPTSEEPQDYEKPPQTPYQERIREGSDKLYNHTPTNHRQSTIEKMSKQERGTSLYDSYQDAWYRLIPEEPSPTVKENHNAPFVHPTKDRVTTPRECARLQNFPDSFVFEGPKSKQLVQIGNAVPPAFGRAWGNRIHKDLYTQTEEEEVAEVEPPQTA